MQPFAVWTNFILYVSTKTIKLAIDSADNCR